MRAVAGPLVALLLLAPARADELTPERVNEALDKGKAWLAARQRADGAFVVQGGGGSMAPGALEVSYPLGTTALATLALLKCGVPANDPAIERAFGWMYAQGLGKTYEVAVLVLAIEARFAPPPELLEKEEEKKGYATVARRHFAKQARPADLAKLKECADWLVANRAGAVWRYPGAAGDGAEQDHSNAQYALLALKSAARLGIPIAQEVWEKVADHFVAQQDAQGEEVPWFAVPAADGPIQDMVAPAKRDAAKEEKRPAGGTRERETPRSAERATLRARGWSYLPRKQGEPPPAPGGPLERVSTGGMTASGIAALVIAKSELEGNKAAWAKRADPVNQAIRDGCAWLARHFIPDANPAAGNIRINWTYYYLYGCERAGVLAGTYRFGGHDWWDEGAAWLLKQQQRDGCWPSESALSEQADTCFALLFLKRATVPLVPLPPKRVMTGAGR